MATLEQKIAAEREALLMLEQNGLPEPDDIEYGNTCIRLIWWEPKAALVVQIDPPPPGWVFAEELRDLDDLNELSDSGKDDALSESENGALLSSEKHDVLPDSDVPEVIPPY